jgi:hypothetical protein
VIRFSLVIPESPQGSLIGGRLAISPDGTQIVYAANRQLYIRSLSDPEPKALPGAVDTISANSPVFSPDGRSIAFFGVGARALKSIPTAGGSAVTLARIDALGVFGIDWTGDGILLGQRQGIMQVYENGGASKWAERPFFSRY